MRGTHVCASGTGNATGRKEVDRRPEFSLCKTFASSPQIPHLMAPDPMRTRFEIHRWLRGKAVGAGGMCMQRWSLSVCCKKVRVYLNWATVVEFIYEHCCTAIQRLCSPVKGLCRSRARS